MAKILFGIVAVIACFYLADSLRCNRCTVSLFGVCLNPIDMTCSTNTSVCYTSRATFSNVSSFSGFSRQGCTESSVCPANTTITNSSTIGPSFFPLSYAIISQCCSTDKCNPVSITAAAPANAMSLSVALSAAALAAFWGSHM
uniref:UPAR/Ly6 domain-containing protein n=1 Tax=Neogobius melanostomus TaxID=47308 RepID=A0A8C6V538_9GOBI